MVSTFDSLKHGVSLFCGQLGAQDIETSDRLLRVGCPVGEIKECMRFESFRDDGRLHKARPLTVRLPLTELRSAVRIFQDFAPTRIDFLFRVQFLTAHKLS